MVSIKLNWVGPYFADHSIAIVNRNLCSHLREDPHINLRIDSQESPFYFAGDLTNVEFLPFRDAGVAVVHQWKPDWVKPVCRRWISMQAWEYGAVPQTWYFPMKELVDEIWVYSAYNKECYIRSGIPERKVHVIPLGVDERVYHPGAPPLEIEQIPDVFRFLFVGGTISRKGFDLLLSAYLDEFTVEDEVCLVIKDNGTDSFYKGMTMQKTVFEAMSQPKRPRIKYMDTPFTAMEIAGLYKACDCLVHPYRGEGFGLPIAEAMACGIPVIVPDKGPSLDLCSEDTAFFVHAEEVPFTEKKVGSLETVDTPWWLSVDKYELQRTMRQVFKNRESVIEKGRLASNRILSSFTWKNSAKVVSDRIRNHG